MGTASRDPHLICRSKISLGFGTWAELENQDWPKNTQECQKTPRYEGRGGPRRGSYTLPCVDSEELSPSEGLGVHSLLFREEEEAMEQQCNRKQRS